MKTKLLMSLVTLVVMGMTQVSFAKERLVLKFYGEQFRGENTLYLKNELKAQLGVRPNQYELRKVVLVAKTKKGKGKAMLKVGQDYTFREVVGGNPYDFHTEDAYTYERTRFFNPKSNSKGVWQIHLKGNFKVKKVVVVVDRKRRPAPQPPRTRIVQENVKNVKVNKFIENIYRVNQTHNKVMAIVLRAEGGSVEVHRATVQYANGDVEDLYDLEGRIGKNSSKRAMTGNKRGRNIVGMRVIVSTNKITGSRPKLSVDYHKVVNRR